MSLRIVYVGPDYGTSLQRADALRDLGHALRHVANVVPSQGAARQVYRVSSRLGIPTDPAGANAALLEALRDEPADVLWIDKGLNIRPRTLRTARTARPALRIVAYSPDDMLNPRCQSRFYLQGIALYDLHVTTKSYNVPELLALGAKDVLFVDKAYCSRRHRPLELTAEERARYTSDVGFVGAWESERGAEMARLAADGVPVTIWGPGWERQRERPRQLDIRGVWLDDVEYPKALNAIRINLGFLRKANRDLQTARSVEIPACAAFLLAERTQEHLRLFAEGEEAEFFEGYDELARKCRYYLEHEERRAAIARAGRERCVRGGYANTERLATVVDYLARKGGTR